MTTRVGFDPNATGKKREESAQSKQMHNADDPFQIDKWYDACKQHTFETKLIPLSIEQANAIKFLCHYFKLFKEHEIESGESKGKGLTLNYDKQQLLESFKQSNSNESSILNYEWGESFNWKALDAQSSLKYINPLKELEASINEIIDEFKCDDGIFIRLNTRSPKDSSIEGKNTFKLLFNELKEWNKINENDDNNNILKLNNDQICLSFYRCATKSLCCKNGFEAIELLTRSYQRIFTDLNLAMLKQGEENLKLFCTIRKWYSIIDPIWEFRLIVKNYIPTALTQYHKTIVIPNSAKHKQFFQDRIMAEFNIIKDKLDKKLKDYTIDFAVVLKDKDLQNKPINDNNDDDIDEVKEDPIDRVLLIEINHEPPIAGTALFDFKNEEDRKVMNGEKPFEFRIYQSKKEVEYDKINELLPDNTLDFLKVLRGEYTPQETINDDNNNDGFKFCVLL